MLCGTRIRPVCFRHLRFCRYIADLNIWQCPLCGREVTDESVYDGTSRYPERGQEN